jgi:putative ABC transport system permease protein
MKLFKTLRLATKDYLHEWQVSICFVLALAAVLGPMLVLFGLKFGIIGGMIDELIEDPANREIRPVSSARFDDNWINQMRARKDVEFILPRTRSIAATVQLSSTKADRFINVEMIPTAKGDPLLKKTSTPETINQIVLSPTAARKLNIELGDQIKGSVTRRYLGEAERVEFALTVIGIADADAFTRDGAFVNLELMEAIENYRDGIAVPNFNWSGSAAPPERTYPSFRLFSRSIYDVAGLQKALNAVGVEVRTKSSDIELVMKMDRNLTMVYWAIAIIGLFGFSLSLGASLWANVDRKRKELSVLRLVGFRTGDIVWFPMTQAIYTAVLGWGLAIGLYQAVAITINAMMADQTEGQSVCVLLPEHFIAAGVVTIAAAIVAAALSGARAARIAPSDGLREI